MNAWLCPNVFSPHAQVCPHPGYVDLARLAVCGLENILTDTDVVSCGVDVR